MKYVGVDVGEKTTYWLHVVAHGRPGHGSRPNPDSAPNRLVRALDRISAYRTPLRVLPVVDEFLRDMAPQEPPERAAEYRDIRKAIEDKRFQEEVERDESLNFLLRDTISLTMMGGSEQTNVIPPEAWANLDVRILPGGDPKTLLAEVRRVVDDPNVSVEPWKGEFRVANYSGTDNALFAAIREVSGNYFPGRRSSRILLAGIRRTSDTGRWGFTRTDSIRIRRRRMRGIPSTGMMSGFGWRKCGGGRGFCLMWWRRWRGSKLPDGSIQSSSKRRAMSAVAMLRQHQ